MKNSASAYISIPYKFEIPLSRRKFFRSKKKILLDFNLNEFAKKNLFHFTWDAFKASIDKTAPTGEKILQLFKNNALCLGPKKNVDKQKEFFLERFNYFIEGKKPITFVLTQFAFKIPNPLKIKRKVPDLGELAFISELYDITQLISHVYKPGARIVIFGESYVFNKVVGISAQEADAYFKTIKQWIKKLGWDDNLVLTNLKELEKKIQVFKSEYKKNFEYFERGWKEKNSEVEGVINAATPTLYMSLNTRRYAQNVLMDVFDNDKKGSRQAQQVRKLFKEKTMKVVFPYLAYHKSISTSKLGDTLFPYSIKLGCTEGLGKLCIYPIGRQTKLYTYHGIPVLNKDKTVTIAYEVDIKRKRRITAHYIKNESTPFYYTIDS